MPCIFPPAPRPKSRSCWRASAGCCCPCGVTTICLALPCSTASRRARPGPFCLFCLPLLVFVWKILPGARPCGRIPLPGLPRIRPCLRIWECRRAFARLSGRTGCGKSGPAPLHWLCMGIVLLRLANGDSVVRRGGHAFAEKYLKALADACREALPSDVLAARVGRWEIALLFPASGRGACHKLARAALTRMEAVRLLSAAEKARAPTPVRRACPVSARYAWY